jgi:hypothetical protein
MLMAGMESWTPSDWGEVALGTSLIVGAIWAAARANTHLADLREWRKNVVTPKLMEHDHYEVQLALIKERLDIKDKKLE